MKKIITVKSVSYSVLAFIMVMANAIAIIPQAQAEEKVNLNDLAPYANRTREEVAQKFYQILKPSYYFAGSDTSDYYLDVPSVENPYKGGELNAAVHQSMTDMLNYYRWLMGVQEVKGVSSHSAPLQKAAVIEYLFFKQYQTLTHFLAKDFKKPVDMDEDFWREGANAPNNIVSAGYRPQGSIEGFFDEGYNNRTGTFDSIGHRFTLLSKSSTNGFDFGYANFVTFGLFKNNTAGGGTTNLPIVPFPAPGYFPANAASSYTTAWSFELGTYSIISNDQLQVKVTNLRTGEEYTVTQANGGLIRQYGDNIVYKQPKINDYRYSDSYQIDIQGLADPNGNPKTITYTTHFTDITDYANFIPTTVERASLPNVNKLVLQPSYNGVGDAVPFAAISKILPPVEITTNTKYVQKLPVNWKLELSAENKPTYKIESYSPSDLHANITDPNHKILDYQIAGNVEYTEVNRNAVTTADEGKGTSITLKPMFTADNVQYHWFKLKDNGEVEPVDNDSVTLTFSKAKLSDAGKYFAYYIHNGVLRVTGLKTLNIRPKTVASISVRDFNSAFKYYQGDSLQLGNASIDIVYSDDSTDNIPLKPEYISGYNTNKVGSQNLSVTYGGKKTTITVEVLEKTLTEVLLKNDLSKKEYRQGEELDLTGAKLELVYINGARETIALEKSMLSPYAKDTVGEQELTITYKGKTLHTTVTVLPDAARALELAKEAAKKQISALKQLKPAESQSALSAIAAANTIEEIQQKVAEYQAINQPRQELVNKRLYAENLIESMQYLSFLKYYFLDKNDKANSIEDIEKNILNAIKENKKAGGSKYDSARNAKLADLTGKINALDTLSEENKNAYIKQLNNEPYLEKLPAIYDQAVKENANLKQTLAEKQEKLAAAKKTVNALNDLSTEDKNIFLAKLDSAQVNEYDAIVNSAKEKNQSEAERKAKEEADRQAERKANDYRATYVNILAKTEADLGLEDKSSIVNALQDYAALPAEVKSKLAGEYQTLSAFKTKIDQLEAQAEAEKQQLNAYRQTHAETLSLEVNNVSLAEEAQVKAALSDLAALPDSVQTQLSKEKTKLESLAAKVANLRQEEEAIAQKVLAFKQKYQSLLAKNPKDIVLDNELEINNSLADLATLSPEVAARLATEQKQLQEFQMQLKQLRQKAAEEAALAQAKADINALSELSESEKQDFIKELEANPVSEYESIIKRAKAKNKELADKKQEENNQGNSNQAGNNQPDIQPGNGAGQQPGGEKPKPNPNPGEQSGSNSGNGNAGTGNAGSGNQGGNPGAKPDPKPGTQGNGQSTNPQTNSSPNLENNPAASGVNQNHPSLNATGKYSDTGFRGPTSGTLPRMLSAAPIVPETASADTETSPNKAETGLATPKQPGKQKQQKSTTVSDTQVSEQNQTEGSYLWWILGIGATVLVSALLVILVVSKKRRDS